MNSPEIVAVFLVAIGVRAGRSALGILALISAAIGFRRRPNERPAARIMTAFGEFVKDIGVDSWHGWVVNGNREIHVLAGDVNGNPNPLLLDRLAGILAELTSLELIARAAVETLTDKHILDGISDDESAEFVLGFGVDDEDWAQTVDQSVSRVVRSFTGNRPPDCTACAFHHVTFAGLLVNARQAPLARMSRIASMAASSSAS